MEGMRPGFPPRFEGPDGPFFNRMPFDDHHPRYRRHEERRRFPREENSSDNQDKPDRRSRWSGGSPSRLEDVKNVDNKEDVESKEIENIEQNEALNKDEEKSNDDSVDLKSTNDIEQMDESQNFIPTTSKKPPVVENNENEQETKEETKVETEETV